MSDQDRISPYIINTILSGKVMRIKKNISEDYKSIQYQILQTNITRTVNGRLLGELLMRSWEFKG